jgi:hypothetical protein
MTAGLRLENLMLNKDPPNSEFKESLYTKDLRWSVEPLTAKSSLVNSTPNVGFLDLYLCVVNLAFVGIE